MRLFLSRFFFLSVLSLLLSPARTALARGIVEGEVAAQAGASLANGIGDETPFGPGFGGRLGISIYGVYAGVAAAYYVGNLDAALYQGGFEAGYGFRLLGDRLTLRPILGIGSAVIAGDGRVNLSGVPGTAQPDKWIMTGAGFLYYEPELTCLVTIDGPWFAGVDLGVIVIPKGLSDPASSGNPALVAAVGRAQFGLRF